jgi:hypothetical protein
VRQLPDGRDDLLAAIRNSGVSSLRKTPKENLTKRSTNSVPFKTLAELKKPASSKGLEDSAKPPVKSVDLAADLKLALQSFRNKVHRPSISDDKDNEEDSGWSHSGSTHNSLSKLGSGKLANSGGSLRSISENPKGNMEEPVKSKKPLKAPEKLKDASAQEPFKTCPETFKTVKGPSAAEIHTSKAQENIQKTNPFALKSQNTEKVGASFSESDNPFNRLSSLPKSNQLAPALTDAVSSVPRMEIGASGRSVEPENVVPITNPFSDHFSTMHISQAPVIEPNGINPFGDNLPIVMRPSEPSNIPEDTNLPHQTSASVSNVELFPQSTVQDQEPGPFSQYEVKGLYDLIGTRSDDLSFIAGDIITVLQEHGEWLYGTSARTALSGWFPKNYIDVISSNLDNSQINSIFKMINHRRLYSSI